ncbi:site-specific integrase [Enterococcus sp. BWT-B8]|uniref:tyrosine-type recombinase/integrase n=1 Tax=unclassified Enterococcus TaxID=2608891 RepID=UPI001E512C3B|nr:MULTISPECIES: site-specific integrase [unclassified Enterococcus]MCB5951432.1 site-specific integrase [Enterococcus sp. BWT-B8]MCB5954991.1 site-specific integrase [Enterococcus sp. CWB-B31]
MVKRGENIYKRKDGRWEGRYRKARNQNGRIIYGYIYGKKYSEVREKLSQKRTTVLDEPSTVYDGTISDWLDYWLSTAVRVRVKPSTWTNYESKSRNHIRPYLGKKKLSSIERKDIIAFIQQLSALRYSESTIKNILTILKSMFNYALDYEYISGNPCSNISISARKAKKVRALSIDTQRRLEALSFQERECSAVIIGLATGMRIGEISALRWEDIDFYREVITVQRTLQRIPDLENTKKTKIIISSPKTSSSQRDIPLPKYLKEYLLSKKRLASSEYVISANGSFAEPRVINYRLKKLLETAEMEVFSFHVLRHTFATRCVESGVDVSSLSKLLGHTSTKLTLDTYTDSMWEKRKEAMTLMDQKQFIERIN